MSRLLQLTDDDLLRRALAGDEEAFTALYRRRQGGVYRYVLQMSGSRSIAEEVTQEVFLTLIRDGRRYDPARGSVVAYLYGIGRNFVMRCLERDGRYTRLADDGSDDQAIEVTSAGLATDDDPLGGMIRGETVEQVRQAVKALPIKYREVIVLCELEEVGYEDAAKAMGCAVGTVRSRLHRARAMLLKRLRELRLSELKPGRDQSVKLAGGSQ